MHLGLIIYGSLDTLSGGYLYDRKLVEYLRRTGDTVEVLSLPWRNYAAHLTDNLRFRLPAGFDLVIEDELNHPSFLAANRGRHPCPVISLVHHLRCSESRPVWQNALYRAVERGYLRSVDGFIFNSTTTQRVVQGLTQERRPSIVAYPPTDRFGEALGESEVQARARETGPLRVLFLGNVIPRKGLRTLLEAVSRTPGKTQLDVVGALTSDPVHAQDMQNLAKRNGLSSAVRFHGALDNEPLAKMLRRAQVLAVPSSYEGFGIVYLEGMAFGLPAIGTDSGAASEIIHDAGNGYLIPPGDAAALASRLGALASDRALLARLSLSALERYRLQPAWETTADEIREFLLKMASTHGL